MLVLITIIVVFRLSKIKNEGVELSQKIFDSIFKDLDFSLRELGAGDVSVANNMKNLSLLIWEDKKFMLMHLKIMTKIL